MKKIKNKKFKLMILALIWAVVLFLMVKHGKLNGPFSNSNNTNVNIIPNSYNFSKNILAR